MSASPYGDYLDGLLEGHESRGYQIVYKVGMFCFLCFGLFGVISSFLVMKEARFTYASIVISVALLGFMGFTLFLVKNYRAMNMDPVWRNAAFTVMWLCMLLAAANAILLHEALTLQGGTCSVPVTTTTTTTRAPFTTLPPGATTSFVTPKPNASLP
jgi:hypothetical protein